MIEKVAYKRQQEAKLGIVMQIYIQQSLGTLVEHMSSDIFNKGVSLEQVKHLFSMTTKGLDLLGRSSYYSPYNHYKRHYVVRIG